MFHVTGPQKRNPQQPLDPMGKWLQPDSPVTGVELLGRATFEEMRRDMQNPAVGWIAFRDKFGANIAHLPEDDHPLLCPKLHAFLLPTEGTSQASSYFGAVFNAFGDKFQTQFLNEVFRNKVDYAKQFPEKIVFSDFVSQNGEERVYPEAAQDPVLKQVLCEAFLRSRFLDPVARQALGISLTTCLAIPHKMQEMVSCARTCDYRKFETFVGNEALAYLPDELQAKYKKQIVATIKAGNLTLKQAKEALDALRIPIRSLLEEKYQNASFFDIAFNQDMLADRQFLIQKAFAQPNLLQGLKERRNNYGLKPTDQCELTGRTLPQKIEEELGPHATWNALEGLEDTLGIDYLEKGWFSKPFLQRLAIRLLIEYADWVPTISRLAYLKELGLIPIDIQKAILTLKLESDLDRIDRSAEIQRIELNERFNVECAQLEGKTIDPAAFETQSILSKPQREEFWNQKSALRLQQFRAMLQTYLDIGPKSDKP